MATRKL